MKLSALFLGLFVVSAYSQKDKKYDLSNKNQFTFYFRENWETMFNTPQPLANPARENIKALLSEDMYFQPCFLVERKPGTKFFSGRLWGMMHALKKCNVQSSKLLKESSPTEFEFIQTSSYTSYTNRFHESSMEIKAKKAAADQPYRITSIIERCKLE